MLRTKILSAALLTIALASGARADQTLQIDQQQTSSNAGGSGYVLQANSGVGQTFMPTLSGIDFFDFELANTSSTTPVNGLTLTLYTSTGTPLAVSDPVSLPANSGPALVQFDFASRVSLTPGQTYAAIFTSGPLTGVTTLMGYGTNASAYTGGSAVSNSKPVTGYSAVFQEGIFVPEPATLSLAFVGVVCLWGRSKLRRVKAKDAA